MNGNSKNVIITVYLSKEEKKVLEQKKLLSNSKTISQFVRKCILNERIFVVDIKPFIILQEYVCTISNNFNHHLKEVTPEDLEKMNEKLEYISKEMWKLHVLLLKLINKVNK